VRVTLERVGDRAVLSIRDDGVGVAEGFDVAASRSLGLTVARQFAQQLGADLAIERDGGTVSRLEMPVG
jgi:two-component sensor histidine kinase